MLDYVGAADSPRLLPPTPVGGRASRSLHLVADAASVGSWSTVMPSLRHPEPTLAASATGILCVLATEKDFTPRPAGAG
jgi:hypothetical protein